VKVILWNKRYTHS